MHNRVYAGIGLGLFDGGMGYTDVASLAIHAVMGEQIDNAALVQLLHTNVVGTALDAATTAGFVALLADGSFTQASLTTFAADQPPNAARIDLVGLATSGLEFTPPG